MKISITLLVSLLVVFSTWAQKDLLSPANISLDHSLIKEESFKMNWYILQDSSKQFLAELESSVQQTKDTLILVTKVKMPGIEDVWIDSSVVLNDNFQPIYHSSYNLQREMVLQFEDSIHGHYVNHYNKSRTSISKVIDTAFFDSNFYPYLLRFLPYKRGYNEKLSIFDYSSESEGRICAVTIQEVTKKVYLLGKVRKKAWKIKVVDDIAPETVTIFYVDRKSRKLLAQEIDMNGTVMFMERIF